MLFGNDQDIRVLSQFAPGSSFHCWAYVVDFISNHPAVQGQRVTSLVLRAAQNDVSIGNSFGEPPEFLQQQQWRKVLSIDHTHTTFMDSKAATRAKVSRLSCCAKLLESNSQKLCNGGDVLSGTSFAVSEWGLRVSGGGFVSGKVLAPICIYVNKKNNVLVVEYVSYSLVQRLESGTNHDPTFTAHWNSLSAQLETEMKALGIMKGHEYNLWLTESLRGETLGMRGKEVKVRVLGFEGCSVKFSYPLEDSYSQEGATAEMQVLKETFISGLKRVDDENANERSFWNLVEERQLFVGENVQLLPEHRDSIIEPPTLIDAVILALDPKTGFMVSTSPSEDSDGDCRQETYTFEEFKLMLDQAQYEQLLQQETEYMLKNRLDIECGVPFLVKRWLPSGLKAEEYQITARRLQGRYVVCSKVILTECDKESVEVTSKAAMPEASLIATEETVSYNIVQLEALLHSAPNCEQECQ
ncbi:hypothetical protein CYMTET_11372 [Cymbomonas tetramitiformis]|uniref:Uncharacterized protein n=1 Tax=Cymbomonas tetramitiformis TaxID=36881 RepID=A0AAE0LD82_9CHLO|nr:hypothetical protein CYMTET_11372 [Cymbomonas tetramitiformis]